MKMPRVRKKRTEQTISATDEEWDDVHSGAKKARMSASAWAVHCALTVDPLPRKHRRLVLDEKEQRSMPRAVGEHARSLIADIDAPSQFADDLGALLKARLETMVREGRDSEAEAILRQVLGDERAAAIAAALTANVEKKNYEMVVKKVIGICDGCLFNSYISRGCCGVNYGIGMGIRHGRKSQVCCDSDIRVLSGAKKGFVDWGLWDEI